MKDKTNQANNAHDTAKHQKRSLHKDKARAFDLLKQHYSRLSYPETHTNEQIVSKFKEAMKTARKFKQ